MLMAGKQYSLDSRLDLVLGIQPSIPSRAISEPTAELPLVEDVKELDSNGSAGTSNIPMRLVSHFQTYFRTRNIDRECPGSACSCSPPLEISRSSNPNNRHRWRKQKQMC